MVDLNPADETVFIPRTVGPYQVETELGAGAMGTVFRAMHTGLDRAVALKVLRPDTLQDPDSVRRFLREARSIARLEHPHIVSVYDAGERDGLYYIAMKLLEGETLQALLTRTGPLGSERAVRLGGQLASALDYAHGQDVIHLDVKPANVMVAAKDYATLTDFSIAQALNPGATRSATISGTPLYMSPEQIRGKDIDSRSDLYSLGLLLYEMCTGSPPFQGPFVTVMYAHLHTPVPDIRAAAPGISEPLAAVIERALAKDSQERFQTAGEMLRALDRCVDTSTVNIEHTVLLDGQPFSDLGGGSVASPVTAPHAATVATAADAETLAPTPVQPWRKPAMFAGGLVLVAAAAATGWTLSRGGASGGTLAITSIPAGATVMLDGRKVGSAPLTVHDVHSGQHQVTLSLPTYEKAQERVQVRGGKTANVTYSLTSWPLSRLISVGPSGLATSYSYDAATNQTNVTPLPSPVPGKMIFGKTITAITELRLRPTVSTGRTVHLQAAYQLFDPYGNLQLSFEDRGAKTLVLDQQHSHRLAVGGFVLHKSSARPLLGTYRVKLFINGQVVKTLSFSMTS